MNSPVLIIGKGAAGMASALYLAELCPDLPITLVDKNNGLDSSTRLAQGGLAAVLSAEDSFEAHVSDTLKAGHQLNVPETVWEVISRAPEVIRDLSDWGVHWDLSESGSPRLGLEGGHSHPRIVHRGDLSGRTIHQSLSDRLILHPNIRVEDQAVVRDLWISDGVCTGAILWRENPGREEYIVANQTILATGGLGGIFPRSTNSPSATGDGLAMGIRAGAQTDDLNWIQFHPTALDVPGTSRAYLLTEALRGAGAWVVNALGRRFLFDSLPVGELAPRDLVSAAIWQEISSHPELGAYLDCRHLPKDVLAREFPQVRTLCAQVGLDPEQDLLPISPAAHYQCGGLTTNLRGETSIRGLLAVGEVAYTGLHGSNRLASNSLTEALLMAKNAATHIATLTPTFRSLSSANSRRSTAPPQIPRPLPWRETLSDHYLRSVPPDPSLRRKMSDRLQLLHLCVDQRRYTREILEERNLLQIYWELFQTPRFHKTYDLNYQKNRI